ncbi:MAG: glycoside hydrolase domain-containing protein, partial [Polyangiaceae bacterium]
VTAPRTAAAGTYRGTFTVTSEEGSATVPVSLTVWNFTLPLVPSLRSSFLVSGTQNLDTYRELLRNRVMPSSVDPSEERTLIDGMGLSCANIGFWSGADGSTCTMAPAPAESDVAAAVGLHQPDLSLYAYTADEVAGCSDILQLDATIKSWAQSLHAAGVKNLITMAPDAALFDDGTGRPAVDLWVMLPKSYDAAGALNAQALALGTSEWSYNTCVQDDYSPKWEIDFAPINYRIQPGFLSQSLSLSGLLYWRVDYWTSSPWTDVTTLTVSGVGFAGEGMLLYPGADVGTAAPAPSMRLKWLRDGVDDYEYVEILKKLGQGDMALLVARSVGPDWHNWT